MLCCPRDLYFNLLHMLSFNVLLRLCNITTKFEEGIMSMATGSLVIAAFNVIAL